MRIRTIAAVSCFCVLPALGAAQEPARQERAADTTINLRGIIDACIEDYCERASSNPDAALDAVRACLAEQGAPEPADLREIISLHIGQAGCQVGNEAPPPSAPAPAPETQPTRTTR
jgi:hypothetical protein